MQLYIRDALGNRAILPEETVHNLGTRYMKAEYRAHEYEKEKGTEKEHIKLWYRQAGCLHTSRKLLLTHDYSCHF